MPPRITAADERLMAAYQEAALQLSRMLSKASPDQRAAVLRRVESILFQLEELSAKYIGEQIPVHFKNGSAEAINDLRRHHFRDIDTTFGTIHKEAVQALVEDSSLKFANTIAGVRREAEAAISKALKEQIMREIVQSEIEGGGSSERVKKVFLDEGITAVRSPNRGWLLEDYSSMLTRTIVAEAHNTGAMTRYVSNGIEFGEVIERSDACAQCAWMRGKIVWLGDRRLFGPFHPNCMGGVKPFLGTTKDPIMSPDDPRIPNEVRKLLLKRG